MRAMVTCTPSSCLMPASKGFRQARAAAEEILRHCIKVGGTITGEHGVGMEKNELMGELFGEDTLDTIQQFKDLFDQPNLMNPGKVLPTGRGCLEIRQPALPRTGVVA